MNRTKIIIIILILVLGMLIVLLVLSNKREGGVIESIPTYTPVSPTPVPFNRTNVSKEEQLQAEREYAKERQRILNEKPWILKMPLRNEDYFLSYDSELDVFDVTIYISPKYPKEEQVNRIKQRISKDLANIGVNVNKVKINYTEKEI